MTRELELSVPASDLWGEEDQRLNQSTVAGDSVSPDCDGDSIKPWGQGSGSFQAGESVEAPPERAWEPRVPPRPRPGRLLHPAVPELESFVKNG